MAHAHAGRRAVEVVRTGSTNGSDDRPTLIHDAEADAAGWVAYGGVLTLILAAMYLLFAVVAIIHHEWSVWASREVLLLSPLGWGWVHLGVAVFVAAAGLGILSGSATGRRAGALVVAGAMLVSFLAFNAFPLWSSVTLVLGAVVLYCLVARGGMAARRGHPQVCRHP